MCQYEKEIAMSHQAYRNALTLAGAVAALSLACASDQQTSNTADNAAAEASTDTSAPRPGDANMPAPNGQPTSTPPSAPPPQSLNETTTPGNAVAMPKAADGNAALRLSEGQIAMVTDAANSAEIEQGKLAQNKAKAASVKKFAAMMVKHHGEAKAEQAKLFKQLSLTPTQSQKATALQQDAEKTLTSLRSATGTSFDASYIDSQVEAHQKVLDALDNDLLPAATDQQLIDALNKMKATVKSHLQEAKTIQAELAKSTTVP
jgi:putative membrane protein